MEVHSRVPLTYHIAVYILEPFLHDILNAPNNVSNTGVVNVKQVLQHPFVGHTLPGHNTGIRQAILGEIRG